MRVVQLSLLIPMELAFVDLQNAMPRQNTKRQQNLMHTCGNTGRGHCAQTLGTAEICRRLAWHGRSLREGEIVATGASCPVRIRARPDARARG